MCVRERERARDEFRSYAKQDNDQFNLYEERERFTLFLLNTGGARWLVSCNNRGGEAACELLEWLTWGL